MKTKADALPGLAREAPHSTYIRLGECSIRIRESQKEVAETNLRDTTVAGFATVDPSQPD